MLAVITRNAMTISKFPRSARSNIGGEKTMEKRNSLAGLLLTEYNEKEIAVARRSINTYPKT